MKKEEQEMINKVLDMTLDGLIRNEDICDRCKKEIVDDSHVVFDEESSCVVCPECFSVLEKKMDIEPFFPVKRKKKSKKKQLLIDINKPELTEEEIVAWQIEDAKNRPPFTVTGEALTPPLFCCEYGMYKSKQYANKKAKEIYNSFDKEQKRRESICVYNRFDPENIGCFDSRKLVSKKN